MYKPLELTDLISDVQKQIKNKTGLKCYDFVEKNTPSPFYFIEVNSEKPNNTKTMLRTVFTVWIHAVAPADHSSAGVYEMIDKLKYALEYEVNLPEPYEVMLQTYNGIQVIKTDETGEKHAVLSFDFDICYGYKIKI